MATYLANRRKGKGRPRDQTIPPNSNPTRLSKLEKVNLESLSIHDKILDTIPSFHTVGCWWLVSLSRLCIRPGIVGIMFGPCVKLTSFM